ncbi:MAG TPA: tRNA pseudouridine(55) synthase TruB [Thermomicrobiales bacterium]|nr:tRNA pseudouridine(55) synthase TruB [Thermomicrobiales bacterium]
MAKRKTRGLYHGYLIIDKPAGWTSHDVVGRIRRILGERRAGHAGTLDPAATGVLPIAVGLATRTVEYLSEASKAYRAEFTFGVTTDSADGDGVLTSVKDASQLAERDVVAALARFEGEQMQVPPMHSAIRIDGERLYERVRRGEEVEVPPRPVTIHDIHLESWNPPVARVFVSCSKGTYIRSLARDIGQMAGTGAYMSNLVRVRTGPFTLEHAIRLDELEDLVRECPWERIAAHPDIALSDRPALVLADPAALAWRQGKNVESAGADGIVRVYDTNGDWLGVGQGDDSGAFVRPLKVVSEV